MIKKETELEFLAAWCSYLGERFEQQYDPRRERGIWTGTVEVCAKKKDLRGLRTLMSDMRQTARALAQDDYAELDNELKDKFGMGLRDKLSSEALAFNNVLQRGKIVDEDEYRMLEERAEEIWDDPSKAAELERINKLLSAY